MYNKVALRSQVYGCIGKLVGGEKYFMDPEAFAEWMKRQGHRIFRTASSYWYEAGPRVLQAFPYHRLIRPSREEIHGLMKRGILALRYSTPLDFPDGKASYQLFFHNPYNLDLLKRRVRTDIRHGLKCFNLEQITFERLAKEGWVLQQDTLERQGRLRSMSQAQWERLCRAGEGLPGFEVWAAISEGELAAGLIVCRIDDVANFLYIASHRRFLGDRVNNALLYAVSCDFLKRKGISGIFVTHQSLDAPASVDDFKFRMGVVPVPVRQRVDFHPLLRPFVSGASHKVLARLLQYDPGNPLLAKAEGMLRFYIEGRRPLKEQSWPECVASLQPEILASIGDTQ